MDHEWTRTRAKVSYTNLHLTQSKLATMLAALHGTTCSNTFRSGDINQLQLRVQMSTQNAAPPTKYAAAQSVLVVSKGKRQRNASLCEKTSDAFWTQSKPFDVCHFLRMWQKS